MANVSGTTVNQAVAAKMAGTTLCVEVSGIPLESSLAKAIRLIREHRERTNQAVSATITLGE